MNRDDTFRRRRCPARRLRCWWIPPSKARRSWCLAAIAAMLLRRDSAATRHLVWLLAMVAMLVVPVLSAMLPHWRALPEWASYFTESGCLDLQARPRSPGPPIALLIAARCRSRGSRAASATAHRPLGRSAGFTPRAGDTGNRRRIGRLGVGLDQCAAACVGGWFFCAHPAAAGRSNDALEFRRASNGRSSSPRQSAESARSHRNGS